MKKKILCFAVLALSLFGLTACKTSKVDLNDYLIEERYNLFTAQDDTYCATFSSGMREENYALDGVKGEMVDFGVITIARLDHNPLDLPNCNYVITIDGEAHDGRLEKSPVDNTYTADIGLKVNNDSNISLSVAIGSYSFDKPLTNTSVDFNVDKSAAIKLANKELNKELNNFKKDKNNFEAVMKIVKDYSDSEAKNYYWYVGVVSKNGETLGLLIDAIKGDVVAKKI